MTQNEIIIKVLVLFDPLLATETGSIMEIRGKLSFQKSF